MYVVHHLLWQAREVGALKWGGSDVVQPSGFEAPSLLKHWKTTSLCVYTRTQIFPTSSCHTHLVRSNIVVFGRLEERVATKETC